VVVRPPGHARRPRLSAAADPRRRRRQRPCRHEASPGRVDGQVESLESPRTEEEEISGLGEDDLIDGEVLLEPDDGEADGARHVLAVREHEAHVLLLPAETDLLEQSRGGPRELASRIDQELLKDDRAAPVDRIFDPAPGVERSHHRVPLRTQRA
jgi:hypothetical protein